VRDSLPKRSTQTPSSRTNALPQVIGRPSTCTTPIATFLVGAHSCATTWRSGTPRRP